MIAKHKEIYATVLAMILFCCGNAFPATGGALASEKNGLLSFNFKNTDVFTVTTFLSKHMNKKFIIDPKATNEKISIVLPTAVSKEEAYNAFLVALSLDELATVEQGDITRIEQAVSAERSNIDVLTALPDIKQERIATVVFRLKNVSAKKFYTENGPILQSRSGEARVVEDSNSLLVTDWVSNLHRIKKIIDAVDVPKAQAPL